MTDTLQEGFVKVASTDEIPPGIMRKVEVGDHEILIANIDGKYYAISSVCTHVGGPLDEGRLHGFEVQCPWHGSRFDLRTGEVKGGPARTPEPSYEVRVQEPNILLKIR
ncbi:MAG TPA: non-heme iron oxygenase ferredoxin subunit [Candidatus Bathyarchaeia archaeon]|nr:non-heme iron oxygenase ferredoxin subunit [Candidatus Bathyarchaeia archaeon]